MLCVIKKLVKLFHLIKLEKLKYVEFVYVWLQGATVNIELLVVVEFHQTVEAFFFYC